MDAWTQTSSTAARHKITRNTQVAEAKSFSVGSPEARAAWAAVEEIEGADNSAATKPSLADECDALNPSKECREYANSMAELEACLLYTSPSPRDATLSRMPSSA